MTQQTDQAEQQTDRTVVPNLPAGTIVRTTRALGSPEWHEAYRKGYEFTIASYEDPDGANGWDVDEDGAIDVPFYYGDADGGGNNVCVPADAIEVVMTVEQANARSLPDPKVLAQQIARGIMDTGEFEVHSVDWGEYDTTTHTLTAEFEATTHEGLAFGGSFDVVLRSLNRSDW